jgi:hypothetical protein
MRDICISSYKRHTEPCRFADFCACYLHRYLAGLGYLLLILSIVTFASPYKIIPALVIALLATYRGPSILAKLRITTEQAAAKRQLQAAAAENGGNDVEGEVTLLHYTATHG